MANANECWRPHLLVRTHDAVLPRTQDERLLVFQATGAILRVMYNVQIPSLPPSKS